MGGLSVFPSPIPLGLSLRSPKRTHGTKGGALPSESALAELGLQVAQRLKKQMGRGCCGHSLQGIAHTTRLQRRDSGKCPACCCWAPLSGAQPSAALIPVPHSSIAATGQL
ncbi:Hypothetical predicted protein [Podarcis lilfordi]|uniref:Uncharacterized protein n=1 Tax=Podarcis lilfordi TaxID=74358 RepID=A0AA35PFX3_9SAUR|nr:Hypothetical predicted protein [Podarcis lilfordi]